MDTRALIDDVNTKTDLAADAIAKYQEAVKKLVETAQAHGIIPR